jgi:hypothetical protein
MFHTTFAGSKQEGIQKYEEMKVWLDEMLADSVSEDNYLKRLDEFVNKF